MRIRAHAAATHAGRRRRRNEDAFVERPPLFAVADGMGGAQAGEIASRLAAAALEEGRGGEAVAEQRVRSLIEEANRRVFERAHEDAAASGMGTTMTVALLEDAGVTIGHVGDSRAYRLHDGELEQLTQDHSLVAELVRSGKLTPEEADTHPQRSVITRALGTDPDIDVDVFTIEAEPGDLFLLCSDGLTTMVDNERIQRVFAEYERDLDGAVRALVADANRVGGEDNITVVCFELGLDDPAEETQAMDAPTAEHVLGDEDTLSELDGVRPIAPAPAEPEVRPGSAWRAAQVVFGLLVGGAIALAALYLLDRL